MAYQTYITEALVCGSYDAQGADRSFLLFTRDMGMLYAQAKSVREERSKHRYGLQNCSHIRVTLVRGKAGWRITGVEPIQNLYAQAATRETRAFLRNVIVLIKRVVHGEIVHAEIFDDIIHASAHIEEYPQKKLEYILFLRVLHTLGYIAPTPTFAPFFHCALTLQTLNDFADSDEKKCQEAITRALTESHL